MPLSLRSAPPGYDRDDQSALRSALEAADRQNLKFSQFLRRGRFTPTLGDGTNPFTLSTAFGSYTRFLDEVTIRVTCVWSDIGSAGGVQLALGGLPFPSVNISNQFACARFGRMEGFDFTGTLNPILGRIGPNSSVMGFVRVTDNSTMTDLLANSCSATGLVSFDLTYEAPP